MSNKLAIFLNKLETKKIISNSANQKIQIFVDYDYKQYGKLFLVLSAMMGAIFASAGIFALISHNWDDFPKTVRGIISLFPLLIGLYFYYKAVFEKKSPVWIEASSLFLFLMIGASIALISSTYQLNGDFDRFILIWLGLSIPLFYIGKASGFSLFYLGFAAYFIYPVLNIWMFWSLKGIEFSGKSAWFWLFFLAFLPHFIMQLNVKEQKQNLRGIYLGWLVAILFFVMLPFIFRSGHLFWGLSLILGYFLIDQKYYRKNLNIFSKPFKFMAYFAVFFSIVPFTDRFFIKIFFRLNDFRKLSNDEPISTMYYIVGLALLVSLTILAIKKLSSINFIMKWISYLPFLIIFIFTLYYIEDYFDFDLYWLGTLLFNIYILVLGIGAMKKGMDEKKLLPMIYGLFLICGLLWLRYFSLEWSFWVKGLFFIAVGASFFFINFIYSEELEYEDHLDELGENEEE